MINKSEEWISGPNQTFNDPLTEQIIACAFTVANTLGPGFVEKVYENALAHELKKAGLKIDQQFGVEVYYDGVSVGHYFVDLLVENEVLLELKATKGLDDLHLAQALNYLKSTGLKTCLLINFGTPKIEIRRLLPGRDWNR